MDKQYYKSLSTRLYCKPGDRVYCLIVDYGILECVLTEILVSETYGISIKVETPYPMSGMDILTYKEIDIGKNRILYKKRSRTEVKRNRGEDRRINKNE